MADADRIRRIGSGVLGTVLLLLGIVILLFPGPLALSDRIAFGLMFLLPGLALVYEARSTGSLGTVP